MVIGLCLIAFFGFFRKSQTKNDIANKTKIPAKLIPLVHNIKRAVCAKKTLQSV